VLLLPKIVALEFFSQRMPCLIADIFPGNIGISMILLFWNPHSEDYGFVGFGKYLVSMFFLELLS